MDLIPKIRAIGDQLEQLDIQRDKLIRIARTLNRTAGQGITAIIQGDQPIKNYNSVNSMIIEINDYMNELSPLVSWNTIISDIEEYSEFMILYNFCFNDKFIMPDEIQVPSWIWLTSIADVIGELRRIILRNLISQDFVAARHYFTIFSELSEALRGQVFAKSLVPNLRRKIDIVRAITEKTESDMANASYQFNRTSRS